MLGRKERIVENEKGEKIKIEYGMLDENDSTKAFLAIFGLGFSAIVLMGGMMVGNWMVILLGGGALALCTLYSIGAMMSERKRKLSKREFRDEQIEDLIG